MTNKDFERLTKALVRKHEISNPRSAYPLGDEGDAEWLRSVVAGSIADTILVVEDGVSIDAFES